MEFYFDETQKAKKLWLIVIQMMIGVEIRKIKETLLGISFKYFVPQSMVLEKATYGGIIIV